MKLITPQCYILRQGTERAIARRMHSLISSAKLATCLCFALLLSACASEPKPTAAQRANADLQALLSKQPVSLSAVQGASRRLLVMQDWYGHWQAELFLCQHQWHQAARVQSCKQALAALSMLEYTPQSGQLSSESFKTYLAAYLGSGDQVYLQQAGNYAETPEQQALLAQVEQKFAQAMTKSGGADATVRAESLYRRGKQQQDTALVRRALQAFVSLGNTQKQADAHFLLARLQWQQGRKRDALLHAQRSLLLNGSVGNRFAEQSVRGWLDVHAHP